jgi:hypothetical protein
MTTSWPRHLARRLSKRRGRAAGRYAVEPLIWLPGVRGGGGVRLEDTIVVTDGEPEVLTRAAFDDRLL